MLDLDSFSCFHFFYLCSLKVRVHERDSLLDVRSVVGLRYAPRVEFGPGDRTVESRQDGRKVGLKPDVPKAESKRDGRKVEY